MTGSYPRRARVLWLVAQFYGLLLALIVAPVVALAISVNHHFPQSPAALLALALIPYGLLGLLLVRAALPSGLTVQPNGIPLDPNDAPALFDVCNDAARQAGFRKSFRVFADLSPAPSSLRYLGFAGVRSRYAIVLGLPAMQVLNEEELRSVLVYLFAVVGLENLPEIWLKETRQVLKRVLDALTRRRAEDRWLGRLLKHYIGRADALLAAQAAEAERAVPGSLAPLRERLMNTSKAFSRFWLNDVNPLLQRGYIPPMAEGYSRILQKTHSLALPASPAIGLLRSPWIIEHKIASALSDTHSTSLQQVSWELVPWRVMLPAWEEEVQSYTSVLSSIRAGEIAEFAEHRLLELGRRLFQQPGALPSTEHIKWKAARVLAVALALTLRRTGWQLAYEGAGDAWEFRLGLRTLNPFESVDLLASKKMLEEDWIRLSRDIGIANLPLAVK